MLSSCFSWNDLYLTVHLFVIINTVFCYMGYMFCFSIFLRNFILSSCWQWYCVKPLIFFHLQLRNLVWSTSKHDVYLVSNYSIVHWSSLSSKRSEVLNVSGHVAPCEVIIFRGYFIFLKTSLGNKASEISNVCFANRNILEASWKALLRHKLVHWQYGIICWLLEGFKENLFARYFLFFTCGWLVF